MVWVEWANNRRWANLQLSQRSHSNDVGIQLDWSQWLNDHWQYVLGFDSQADIPLQALKRAMMVKLIKLSCSGKPMNLEKRVWLINLPILMMAIIGMKLWAILVSKFIKHRIISPE
jgi:hypothetical protein